jgi:hypothetical protein
VVDTGVGVGVGEGSFTVKETDEAPTPAEPFTTTGYSPASKVIGIVAVIVLEFTNVAFKGTPIVRARERVKFSPLIVTVTPLPRTVLVGDMLCTTGGGTISKLYQADSSLTGTYSSEAVERTTATAQSYSPGKSPLRVK